MGFSVASLEVHLSKYNELSMSCLAFKRCTWECRESARNAFEKREECLDFQEFFVFLNQ